MTHRKAFILAGLLLTTIVAIAQDNSKLPYMNPSLTPEQRKERGVPETLLSLEEVAGAILRLATDETLFGRLMVWWNGEPPRLIAESDPGFGSLV